jgi:hypothetical protein
LTLLFDSAPGVKYIYIYILLLQYCSTETSALIDLGVVFSCLVVVLLFADRLKLILLVQSHSSIEGGGSRYCYCIGLFIGAIIGAIIGFIGSIADRLKLILLVQSSLDVGKAPFWQGLPAGALWPLWQPFALKSGPKAIIQSLNTS